MSRGMRWLTAAVLCMVFIFSACAAEETAFDGALTGDAALDGLVLETLQEICGESRTETDSARAVYTWVADGIRYRAGTMELPDGFTDEAVAALAGETLEKRRGDCDGEAALMAVLLRRLGFETVIVEGEFLRDDGSEWVDHAWVIAEIDGKNAHLDPLYGRYYAEDAPLDYFMANDAFMMKTHRWDGDSYPVCD